MQKDSSDSAPHDPPIVEHDPYAAIRRPNFRRYWIGNIVSIFGMQMQSVVVGWEVYNRTKSPFFLGLVGLVQVLPVLSLALLAGHVADRVDRRAVLAGALTLSCLASLGLAVVSFFQLPIAIMFVCLFLVGVARAFQQPAKNALVPQLVPREVFPSAVTWNLGGFQLAQVTGPALGGWMILLGYPIVYLAQAAGAMLFLMQLLRVKRVTAAPISEQGATLKSLLEGIRFVWRKKVVLAAMALDMFAVLLGGANAMFPVYAQDILHLEGAAYGMMTSATAAGALVMSLTLMHRPPLAKAGQALLWAVAGFGAAIIVFGLSRSFALSLAALFVTGALDCISVVVRHTLVQMSTPDPMRGRVSAISGMFISASNELGDFESGLVAALTSPVIAVVGGGVGTILVAITTALAVPQLRAYGRLDGKDQTPAETDAPVQTA